MTPVCAFGELLKMFVCCSGDAGAWELGGRDGVRNICGPGLEEAGDCGGVWYVLNVIF